jgi:rod shape-determining protein MreC
MRRFLSFFGLALLLVVLLNLPREIKVALSSSFIGSSQAKQGSLTSEQQLEKENFDLKREIEEIRQYLLDESFFEDILNKVRSCEGIFESEKMKGYFDRRKTEFLYQLKKKLMGVRAQVIYRDARAEGTGIWIDRGLKDNRRLGADIICKNSAVIKGDCVIGVVQEVLEHKSYVHLITDPSIVVSVRSQRGGLQKVALLQSIELLKESFAKTHPSDTQSLTNLEKAIEGSNLEGLYAKGELTGARGASFRTMDQTLLGTGFNLEFKDAEGEGINLHDKDKETLLQMNDTLVTTGLDAIFPANLRVARVTKIEPLKEGAYYYNLEAKPFVDLIYDLKHVEILAPIAP